MIEKISYQFLSLDLKTIKLKVLNWLQQFGTFAYLNNNNYHIAPNRYELLVGVESILTVDNLSFIENNKVNDWWFGHLNYDYKSQLFSQLNSRHTAQLKNEDCQFFKPKIVVSIEHTATILTIEIYDSGYVASEVLASILKTSCNVEPFTIPKLSFAQSFTKESYIQQVQQVKTHIKNGDCYELNLCMQATSHVPNKIMDCIALYNQLNEVNPAPFSALYKIGDCWMIGASPERFIYKSDQLIVAQPMKGTIKRILNDPTKDAAQISLLENNIKERAENLMIVDLMRNDIAKCAMTGSVKTTELCKAYTFPTLHTMISTISGVVKEGMSNVEVLKACFPMGSMTGAPKYIVMQLIDRLEENKRELYSGTLGYMNPDQNFDFNVNIRSLFYNQQSGFLSYETGGAITIDSDPEAEWQEIQLKAVAMLNLFNI